MPSPMLLRPCSGLPPSPSSVELPVGRRMAAFSPFPAQPLQDWRRSSSSGCSRGKREDGISFCPSWVLPQRPPGCGGMVVMMSTRFGGASDGGEGAMNDCLDLRKSARLPKGTCMLFSLVEHVEPLDTSRIGKDASLESTDAMKRTISGMLGLLPSDRFSVTIEALPQALARLLVSSIMTGYTLKNAEYRLCLQRNLDLAGASYEGNGEMSKKVPDSMITWKSKALIEDNGWFEERDGKGAEAHLNEIKDRDLGIPGDPGPITPEASEYIKYLKARLSLAMKELACHKKRYTGIDMNRVAGEEKNELLDFLRSLESEKVAELSRPSSMEVEEAIQKVVTRTVEKMQLSSMQRKNLERSVEVPSSLLVQDRSDLVDNPERHLLAVVTCSRDYLARLLFWCMLLGHYIRGVEYRLELNRILHLSGDID